MTPGDQLADALWGVVGAVFGAGVVYGTVRERLRQLERNQETMQDNQEKLRGTVEAHRDEATRGIGEMKSLLFELLQRTDRRRLPREEPAP